MKISTPKLGTSSQSSSHQINLNWLLTTYFSFLWFCFSSLLDIRHVFAVIILQEIKYKIDDGYSMHLTKVTIVFTTRSSLPRIKLQILTSLSAYFYDKNLEDDA